MDADGLVMRAQGYGNAVRGWEILANTGREPRFIF